MKSIQLFLAFDEKLRHYYSHVFNSAKKNSSINIEPNIIIDKQTSNNFHSDIKIHIIEPEIQNVKKHSMATPYTKGIFYRYYIPYLTDAKKAIYLDNDVVVLGDLRELAEINMGNYLVGAVPNYYQKTVQDTFFMQGICPDGLNNKAYLSGQLLINCEQWRREDITKHFIQYAKTHSILDEACINIICGQRIMELDKYWCLPANQIDENYAHYKLKDYDFSKAKLLHWAGKTKPWESKNCRNKKYYEMYL